MDTQGVHQGANHDTLFTTPEIEPVDKQGVHLGANHDFLAHAEESDGAGTATDHSSVDAVKGLPAIATKLAQELPTVACEGSEQEEADDGHEERAFKAHNQWQQLKKQRVWKSCLQTKVPPRPQLSELVGGVAGEALGHDSEACDGCSPFAEGRCWQTGQLRQAEVLHHRGGVPRHGGERA